MADILMIARPKEQTYPTSKIKTLFLPTDDFWQKEELAQAHDKVLWQAFHTHGKYARKVKYAEWFTVAVDAKGKYLGSAFIVPVGEKWLIEYVMTDPSQQKKGIGSAVMARIMREARKRQIEWVILNCDPKAHGGILPKFYSKFGFKEV